MGNPVFFTKPLAAQLVDKLDPETLPPGFTKPGDQLMSAVLQAVGAIAANYGSGDAKILKRPSGSSSYTDSGATVKVINPGTASLAAGSIFFARREQMTNRWIARRCGSGCIDMCAGVAIPVSVTLVPPFFIEPADPFAEVTWGLSATLTNSVCDLYQTNLVCAKDTNFLTLRDMTCSGEWPANNANDVRYALGAASGCYVCAYGVVVSPRKLAYQEWKRSKRVVIKQKKAYQPLFSISSVTDTDYLLLKLRIDYSELLARSVVQGVSNRVKIVTIECGSVPGVPGAGFVTNVTGWTYADEPVFPDPRMCFGYGAVFCGESTGNNDVYPGSCSEASVLLDYENGSDCSVYPVYLETKIADSWCNVNLSAPPADLQLCSYAATFIEYLLGESGSALRTFSFTWQAQVRCSELYDGPITLVGGPPSGVLVLLYPTISDPNGGTDGTEAIPGCTDAFTPLQRRWAIPPTITVRVNHT